MHYYEVAPNQIVRAGNDTFTYASSAKLPMGAVVVVEVGKKQLIGMIIKNVPKPPYETKTITQLDLPPLPGALINTALWMSSYYATPLATVLQTILPRGIQKNRRTRPSSPHVTARDRTNFLLTRDQTDAIAQISDIPTGTVLLHGVTGSGKTRIYIELAKQTLAEGRSVVILVPEIALTSQLVDEFSHRFSDVLLTHSRQTEAERHQTWLAALTSETPRIAIGPRSALFLPLADIGLIVVDEAHEPSFKQEQSPRYSALRVASILGKNHKGRVVFGSATPSISDYFLAKHTAGHIAALTKPATSNTVKPVITLIDMTKKNNFKAHRFLSDHLLQTIDKTLQANKQALIFHNRRGSASTTLCENCGWAAQCPRCFLPLTLHADIHKLQCHVCGYTEKVPTSCPVCGSVDIIHKGVGTKLIESELQKIFPNKKIVRFDGDADKDNSVEKRYKELYDGEIDIIVGTQVIAKGLDLPHLRAVGVIQADAGLALPDYSASERTFQLLAQVVGRVGRSHHPTEVVVQSYQPTHVAVKDGLLQDYDHFYGETLATRKQGNFPPFSYLLKLTCIYKTEAAAIRNARLLAEKLRQTASSSVEILGPTPAFYERQRDSYRWQLVLKSPRRSELQHLLQYLPTSHWQFELDPTSLL